MNKSRLPWAVLAILLANAPTFAADANRSATEAVAVFGVIKPTHVFGSMEGPPTRCQYDRKWQSEYAVPEELARDFVGPSSRADLSTFEPDLKPETVLDPRHEYGQAFCTATEKETFKKAHLATFEKDKAAKGFGQETSAIRFRDSTTILPKPPLLPANAQRSKGERRMEKSCAISPKPRSWCIFSPKYRDAGSWCGARCSGRHRPGSDGRERPSITCLSRAAG